MNPRSTKLNNAIAVLAFAVFLIGTLLLSYSEVTPKAAHAAVLASMNGSDPKKSVPPGPPNIVVIMTDDEDDGATLSLMPNIQSMLVEQGTNFTNSFVVNPVCCASRASFLSGQYSHNDGVWSNAGEGGGRPGGISAFTDDANALPVWLQQAGYYTGMIGKYLNGYGLLKYANYIPPGWNTWSGLIDPTTYQYYDYTMNENGVKVHYGQGDANYQTDVISGKAVSFINSQASSTQPFFLWVTAIAPHSGAPGADVPEPPSRYKGVFSALALPQPPSFNESDTSDKPRFFRQNVQPMNQAAVNLATDSYRLRAETMLGVDDMVGAIINTLQTTGKLNNTYIIFTSDNGYFNGEHRLPISKYLVYEESIRVPLVVRGPGVPANQTLGAMVNNLDLTAAIVNIASTTPGRTLDGKSWLSLVKNTPLQWRTAMLLEGLDYMPLDGGFYGYYSAIRTSEASSTYIDMQHAIGAAGSTTQAEFYNLQNDQYELQNKSSDANYKPILKTLDKQLALLQTCQGTACWVTTKEPVVLENGTAASEIGGAAASPSSYDNHNFSIPADAGENNLTPAQRMQYYSPAGASYPVSSGIPAKSQTAIAGAYASWPQFRTILSNVVGFFLRIP